MNKVLPVEKYTATFVTLKNIFFINKNKMSEVYSKWIKKELMILLLSNVDRCLRVRCTVLRF
jgi:hypothetical protein